MSAARNRYRRDSMAPSRHRLFTKNKYRPTLPTIKEDYTPTIKEDCTAIICKQLQQINVKVEFVAQLLSKTAWCHDAESRKLFSIQAIETFLRAHQPVLEAHAHQLALCLKNDGLASASGLEAVFKTLENNYQRYQELQSERRAIQNDTYFTENPEADLLINERALNGIKASLMSLGKEWEKTPEATMQKARKAYEKNINQKLNKFYTVLKSCKPLKKALTELMQHWEKQSTYLKQELQRERQEARSALSPKR